MTRAELCAKKNEALEAFASVGKVEYCEPYGNGHINDTFLVINESKKRYILQRINHQIFTRRRDNGKYLRGDRIHSLEGIGSRRRR